MRPKGAGEWSRSTCGGQKRKKKLKKRCLMWYGSRSWFVQSLLKVCSRYAQGMLKVTFVDFFLFFFSFRLNVRSLSV